MNLQSHTPNPHGQRLKQLSLKLTLVNPSTRQAYDPVKQAQILQDMLSKLCAYGNDKVLSAMEKAANDSKGEPISELDFKSAVLFELLPDDAKAASRAKFRKALMNPEGLATEHQAVPAAVPSVKTAQSAPGAKVVQPGAPSQSKAAPASASREEPCRPEIAEIAKTLGLKNPGPSVWSLNAAFKSYAIWLPEQDILNFMKRAAAQVDASSAPVTSHDLFALNEFKRIIGPLISGPITAAKEARKNASGGAGKK